MARPLPLTPVEAYKRRRGRIRLVVALVILLLIGWLIYRIVARFTAEQTAVYEQIEEHFKYGSIGSDNLQPWKARILLPLAKSEMKAAGCEKSRRTSGVRFHLAWPMRWDP